MKLHLLKVWNIVPSYQKGLWPGGEVAVRPTGKRRLLKFLWYQTGSTLNLKLTFTRQSGDAWPIGISIYLDGPSSTEASQDEKLPQMAIGESRSIRAKLGRIRRAGPYTVRIFTQNADLGSSESFSYPDVTVCIFQVIAQEAFTLSILSATLGAAIALAVQRLLGYFL